MKDKNAKNLIKQILRIVIPFILTIVFLYIAFRNIDIEIAFDYILHAELYGIALFVLLFMISHWLRALRWKVMVHSVKEDVSLLNLFGATMIGYGVNAVVPRLGELYRAFFLGKWENLSRSSMFGTVLLERIIDILALGIAVMISIFLYDGNLYDEIEWLESTVILGFSAIGILILMILSLVIFRERFSQFIVKFVGKISQKAADKVNYVFDMMTDGFSTLNSRVLFFKAFLLTVLIMVFYAAASYAGFFMIGMDQAEKVTYSMAWIFMSIGAFGIVIPTPGGTGSYHAISIFVLTTLYGFTSEISAAYAILTHFISYIIFIISPTFFVYLINNIRKKQGKETVNFMTVFKSGVED
ncbi:MAG: flippase-like domain-containing protein [Melioribacteraceae bacterium]|nr:flippase-like domain-containing protein [Melioribacteraceae bacterium]MCF8263965.1 flippase-like domain-containing protein [Melioribacteraceae bacterium]MCF8411817.1 flippase-like domain-containing protein [Melioribacteraceae bacterium]MCF8431814.1 flippase-like domain-containing protein [Melioribacteraceae bacterium]